MARMYSHKKGKSRSTKPSKKRNPGWVRYTGREVKKLITKLAKEGFTPSQIGVHLRDRYGIPDVKLIAKRSVTQILEENDLYPELPEDLMALIKKNIMIRAHLDENKKDLTAKRGLQLTESKIRRLVKYYKKTNRLAADWKYDPERIKLLID